MMTLSMSFKKSCHDSGSSGTESGIIFFKYPGSIDGKTLLKYENKTKHRWVILRKIFVKTNNLNK